MMDSPALRAVCISGTMLLAIAATGRSQDGGAGLLEWRPETGPGPTRAEARAATASALLLPYVQIPILSRYNEFERDFGVDFGVRGLVDDRDGDVLDDLRSRLDARWGDATVYQWIERGLALYARVQASTQLRGKGFDMEVEMDDVAEGKLGLRVQRSLE
jgi:hypothetical protein